MVLLFCIEMAFHILESDYVSELYNFYLKSIGEGLRRKVTPGFSNTTLIHGLYMDNIQIGL